MLAIGILSASIFPCRGALFANPGASNHTGQTASHRHSDSHDSALNPIHAVTFGVAISIPPQSRPYFSLPAAVHAGYTDGPTALVHGKKKMNRKHTHITLKSDRHSKLEAKQPAKDTQAEEKDSVDVEDSIEEKGARTPIRLKQISRSDWLHKQKKALCNAYKKCGLDAKKAACQAARFVRFLELTITAGSLSEDVLLNLINQGLPSTLKGLLSKQIVLDLSPDMALAEAITDSKTRIYWLEKFVLKAIIGTCARYNTRLAAAKITKVKKRVAYVDLDDVDPADCNDFFDEKLEEDDQIVQEFARLDLEKDEEEERD